MFQPEPMVMKRKKQHYTVGTVLKANRKKTVEIGSIDTPNTGTRPLILLALNMLKCGEIRLVFGPKPKL